MSTLSSLSGPTWLSLLVALLCGVSAYWSLNRGKKNIRKNLLGPAGLSILATFIGVAGTTWDSIQKNHSEQIHLELLRKESQAAATGGDSWLYVDINFPTSSSKLIRAVQFFGRYPMFGVSIATEGWMSHPRTGLQVQFMKALEERLGDVRGRLDLPGEWAPPKTDKFMFRISISAGNGRIIEEAYFRRKARKWTRAILVTLWRQPSLNADGSVSTPHLVKTLHREIDASFPLEDLDI